MIVIHKSLKEGFGLVVSEALWKEKLWSRAAKEIPMQFPGAYQQCLVDSIEACAAKLLYSIIQMRRLHLAEPGGKESVASSYYPVWSGIN